MKNNRKATIFIASLMLVSGIGIGTAIAKSGVTIGTSVTVSADDCVYNGLIYVEGDDGNITITGYTEDADLTNLFIPDEIEGKPVTSIGKDAFKYHEKFESVILGNNISYINDNAFYNCSIVDFTLSGNIKALSESAFSYADISELYVSSTVTNIPKILRNNSKLTEIYVEKGNKTYSSDNGILFSADKSTLIKCPQNSPVSSYTLNEKTKTIAESAFANCNNLKEFDTGAGLTTIEKNAFNGHISFESFTLGKNVTYIGDNAFYYDKFSTFNLFSENIESLSKIAFLYTSIEPTIILSIEK